MSFFESITKKSKLKAAILQTTAARNSAGSQADQLFTKVYHDYALVVANEPVIAEALYNWGFTLLHQAKTKSGEQAAELYQDAIAKFSFCLTLEPAYLGAAIDGGVAFMELARIKAVKLHDGLYESAKNYFEQANAIQAGSASYNLACIYGLRGEKEACLTALEISKGKGSLPAPADILADPDLAGVKNQDWFIAFMESLSEKMQAASAINAVVAKDVVVDDTVTKAAKVTEFEAVFESKASDENGSASQKSEVEACSAAEDFK
jgi:tetratricopeptide (TPR) repeat protein